MFLLVSPAPPTAVLGNGVTAERWCGIVRSLGHRIETAKAFSGGTYSGLIALHAGKSAASVLRFRRENPGSPIVVALTGTDLYPSLGATGVDPLVLDVADRLVVLQERGLTQLSARHRAKARVIVQSMPVIQRMPHDEERFEIAFLAHLRPVKDPLLPAQAARLLDDESRIRITHVGAGLDPELADAAAREAKENDRYDWVGELPRPAALEVLARSQLLVLASRHEGGANVVSEALAAGVPVLSTAIDGSIGLLGADYPGYFPVGDERVLARLMRAAELDEQGFRTRLTAACTERADLVDPLTEKNAWTSLLGELSIRVPLGKDRECEENSPGVLPPRR